MKIITRKPLGEKILGVFKCCKCESELEVHIKDCIFGMKDDHRVAGFVCPVCGTWQAPPGLPYEVVNDYHETAKALENVAAAKHQLAPKTEHLSGK